MSDTLPPPRRTAKATAAWLARCLPFESAALRCGLAGWLAASVVAAVWGFAYSAPQAAALRAQAAPLLELRQSVQESLAATEGVDLPALQQRHAAALSRVFPSQMALETRIGQLLLHLQNAGWGATVTSMESRPAPGAALTRTVFELELQKATHSVSAEVGDLLVQLKDGGAVVDIERIHVVAESGSPARVVLLLAAHSAN